MWTGLGNWIRKRCRRGRCCGGCGCGMIPGLVFRMPGREAYEVAAALAEASYIRWDMEDAAEALRLAPARRGDRAYSAAVYGANMIAGMAAMGDGHRSRAVRHLLAADVPPSEDLAYTFDYPALRLAGWLLKDGEREPAITFPERLAAMHVSRKAYLLDSAESIRKGVKPLWYPR